MTQKPHVQISPIFCTCYLWPWLGHPLIAMQYVMYFRFCGWRIDAMFSHNGANGPESKRRVFRPVRQVAAPWAKSAISATASCTQFETDHRSYSRLIRYMSMWSYLCDCRLVNNWGLLARSGNFWRKIFWPTAYLFTVYTADILVVCTTVGLLRRRLVHRLEGQRQVQCKPNRSGLVLPQRYNTELCWPGAGDAEYYERTRHGTRCNSS